MADEFVVDDSVFKVLDSTELTNFTKTANELVGKFEELKNTFNSINETLLNSWKGEGADEYKYETDHILEKIGDMSSAVEALNTDAVSTIIQTISDRDAEIGAQIRKMANDEEE